MSEIVFLAGTDAANSTNQYYALAKRFFTDRDASIPVVGPAANMKALSMESVFAELTRRAKATPPQVFDVVNIVSHAFGMGGMELPLRKTSEAAGGVTMRNGLTNAVLDARAAKAGALLPPGRGAITPKTRIVIFGCDVGRDAVFLTALGELFGTPGSVAAPIRVAVFRLKGGKVQHRLAQTWSVLWGATSIRSTNASGWSTARDAFIAKTDIKFIRNLETGSIIRARAASATLDNTKDEFFFAETYSVHKDAISTHLPVKTAVIGSTDGGGDDDDTTEPVVITAADMTPAETDLSDPNWPTKNITVLASVIEKEVSTADTTQYRTVTFAAPTAPAKGPAPAPTADGSPMPEPIDPNAPVPDRLQEFREQFLAAGGTQAELDDFLAEANAPQAQVPAPADGIEPPTDDLLLVPPPGKGLLA
jgi:hypothetical protein